MDVNKIIRTVFNSAEKRTIEQINSMLDRATGCLKNKIPYLFGGKTLDGLDCSGLVTYCINSILPEGTEKQLKHLEKWLFTEEDIKYFDIGDLVFFSKKYYNNVTTVKESSDSLHVGIVSSVFGNTVSIIHASETRGCVVQDNFDVQTNIFRKEYICIGIAKIKPFLFRFFLSDEINKDL